MARPRLTGEVPTQVRVSPSLCQSREGAQYHQVFWLLANPIGPRRHVSNIMPRSEGVSPQAHTGYVCMWVRVLRGASGRPKLQLPSMALPLRLGPGHVTPPQGPCPRTNASKVYPITCSSSSRGPGLLRLPCTSQVPQAGGESTALACQVPSGCRACAKDLRVVSWQQPLLRAGLGVGGSYSHFSEEVPNSLWPKAVTCGLALQFLCSRRQAVPRT